MMQHARRNFASLRSTKEDFHCLHSHQDGLFLREPEHIPRRQSFLRAHRKDNPLFSCKGAKAALGRLKTLNKNNENRKKPINVVSYHQRELKSGEPTNERLEDGETDIKGCRMIDEEVLTEGQHDVCLSARTSGATYNEPKSTQLPCVLFEVDTANNRPAVQSQGKTSSSPVDDCTILNMDNLPYEDGDEVVYNIFYQDEPFETYKSVMEAGGVNDRFRNNPFVQPRGDTFSSGLFPYMQKNGARQEMIVVGQKMQDFISKLDLMDSQVCEPENITEDLSLETAELWNKKHYSDSSAINNKKNISGLPSESYTKDKSALWTFTAKGLAPQDVLLHEEPYIDGALTNIENIESPNWTNSNACKQGSVEPSHTGDRPSHESLLDLLSEKIQTLDTPKQEYILHILEKLEMGELINSSYNCSKFLKQENKLYVPEGNIICGKETRGQVVVLCLLSSWEDATLVGLTEVGLYDNRGNRIHVQASDITLHSQHIPDVSRSTENLVKVINGAATKDLMWQCPLAPPGCPPLEVEIKLPSIDCELGHLKIWNFNGSLHQNVKGVHEMQVFVNKKLLWKGIVAQACGNQKSRTAQLSVKLSFQDGRRICSNQCSSRPLPDAPLDRSECLGLKGMQSFSPADLQGSEVNKLVNRDDDFNIEEFSQDLGKICFAMKTDTNLFNECSDWECVENPGCRLMLSEYDEELMLVQSHDEGPWLDLGFEGETIEDDMISHIMHQKKSEDMGSHERDLEYMNSLISLAMGTACINMQIGLDMEIEYSGDHKLDNTLSSQTNSPTHCISTHLYPRDRKLLQLAFSGFKALISGLEACDFIGKEMINLMEEEDRVNTMQHHPEKASMMQFCNQKYELDPKTQTYSQEHEVTYDWGQLLAVDYDELLDVDCNVPVSTIQDISVKNVLSYESCPGIGNNPVDAQGFCIPLLPHGHEIVVNILSNWGNPEYVGLSGIEIFDSEGQPAYCKSIQVYPPERGRYSSSCPVNRLVNRSYLTCDSSHMWLTPFSSGKEKRIIMVLDQPIMLGMIRFWNYNASKNHSFCGVRLVQMTLDNNPIFYGEIRKASGLLSDAYLHTENIMFTENEISMSMIESHDERYQGTQSPGAETDRRSVEPREENDFYDFSYQSAAANDSSKGALLKTWKYSRVKEDAIDRTGSFLAEMESLGSQSIGGCILKLKLLQSWGDPYYLGLTGIQVLDKDGYVIQIDKNNMNASPRDLNDIPGHKGDYRTLDKLVNGCNTTSDDHHMWLIPYNGPQSEHSLEIDFGKPTSLSALRIWNYNKSIDDSFRGVKWLQVFVDDVEVPPYGGILIRKAPGIDQYDFGQTLPLCVSNKRSIRQLDKMMHFRKGKKAKFRGIYNDAIYQEYETPLLPCGYILKFLLLSTWGDRRHIGLNGIELYDETGQLVQISQNNVYILPTLPTKKTHLCSSERLFDGVNNTTDVQHMWLATFHPTKENIIYILFEHPLMLSAIRLWNYSRNGNCGVQSLEIFFDDFLIYKGILKKAVATKYCQDFYQSIIFTDDDLIVENNKEHVFSTGNDANLNILFVNDNIITNC